MPRFDTRIYLTTSDLPVHMTPWEMRNRLVLHDPSEVDPNSFLTNLHSSLKHAFGDQMTVKLRMRDMVVTIGPKTAWIDRTGALVGESFTPPSSE
jgi:hypothetical protein